LREISEKELGNCNSVPFQFLISSVWTRIISNDYLRSRKKMSGYAINCENQKYFNNAMFRKTIVAIIKTYTIK
jgi:hypothetical protein